MAKLENGLSIFFSQLFANETGKQCFDEGGWIQMDLIGQVSQVLFYLFSIGMFKKNV